METGALTQFAKVQAQLAAATNALRTAQRTAPVRRALAAVIEAEEALPKLLPRVTVAEAARRLRVSRPTVYSWIDRGVLDSREARGHRWVSGWSVEALAREFDEVRTAAGRSGKQRRLASLARTHALKSQGKFVQQIRASLKEFASGEGVVRE